MSSLIPFSFESHEIRFIPENDSFSVVAKDVADALGYRRFDSNLLLSIPEEWKGTKPIRTLGGIQEMLTLSEPGLYFFIGRSDKPKALPFQKWVYGEVIPAIRKTGRYEAPNFRDPLSDFGPKAQFAVLEMLVTKVAKDIAQGFIDYLRTKPEWSASSALSQPPVPASAPPARRRTAPPDPWEPQVRVCVADKAEVASAEVLRHLGIEDGDQTQNHKNRIAKILKVLGFVGYIVNRGGRVHRIWQRRYHD